jgi:hypothetical protein
MSKGDQDYSLAGRKAKNSGDIAEGEFDSAGLYFVNQGLIDIRPTHPEFVTLGFIPLNVIPRKFRKGGNSYSQVAYGYFKAQATADRVISIKSLGGQTCWVEIKNITGANTKQIKDSRHQYDMMAQAQADGAALGFYAARWGATSKRGDEWRLHPLESVEIPTDTNDHTAIRLHRESGLLIPPFDQLNNLPDWLPVILAYSSVKAKEMAI